jgi:hypothetical protein
MSEYKSAFLQKSGGCLELSFYLEDEGRTIRKVVSSISEAKKLSKRLGASRVIVDRYGAEIK